MKYTQDLSNSDMCVNIDFIVQKVHTVILVLLHFGARGFKAAISGESIAI